MDQSIETMIQKYFSSLAIPNFYKHETKRIDFVCFGNDFVVKLYENYSFSGNSVKMTLFKQNKFRSKFSLNIFNALSWKLNLIYDSWIYITLNPHSFLFCMFNSFGPAFSEKLALHLHSVGLV